MVTGVTFEKGGARCAFQDGTFSNVPSFLGRFLRPQDRFTRLSPADVNPCLNVVIERDVNRQLRQWLFARIGYVGQPKEGERGFYVRADLPSSDGPKSLFLDSGGLRRYFYLLDEEGNGESLYQILQVPESVSLAELRGAWRLRSLELGSAPMDSRARAKAERAFNVLAHHDLRNCYDRLCKDVDAPPLFPYGGFGSIFVEGHISGDGQAFFGNRILAYKPEITARKVSLLLRRCEFFTDRVVCRDPRRRVEVWLDGSLLLGVHWDLTWNQWKHWLKSRIEVEATFVNSGKYRLQKGEWILRQWVAALPSRLRVVTPEELPADIKRAQAVHRMLGEHADLIGQLREQLAKEPVEHTTVQNWFDALSVSRDLKPQHINWQADYEPYYFEQLRKRSRTWFLFRNEYLFEWPDVVIAEIPQPGHATYLFARPDQISHFTKMYAGVTREDVRNNRNDAASGLGFIARVVRGRRRKRWLADVLKQSGEKADYVEVFE